MILAEIPCHGVQNIADPPTKYGCNQRRIEFNSLHLVTSLTLGSGWWFFAIPLKNMKVSWDDYSQYLEKYKNVPNHQPDLVTSLWDIPLWDIFLKSWDIPF